ncbi:MAG: SDR family oxidoreductase [Acidimicrobiales bacterium]|nr:SDR family oxidoreductase [Acidimicrobiales bacterium]
MGEPRMSGLVALVTGGGSGIGLATVGAMRREGARVAALDLRPPPASDGLLPVRADVTDQGSVDAAVAATVEAFGRVDVLVNDAGIGAVGGVEANDDDEWRRVLDVNVMGIVRTARACLPHLRRSPQAAIVNLASIVSWTGLPQRACYGASKGAVLALTLAMAADGAADGIRVNCVCPGTIDTPWVGRLLAATDDPDAARAGLVARQPVGRLGTAEEVAAAIVYLASPEAGYVTGTALAIDGGTHGFQVPGGVRR